MSNKGKQLKVHYVGTLDDGTKFDSSLDRGEPIEFVCGAGQMIPGFDAAVEDMELGATVNVHIPAAQAYGEHNPALLQKVPASQIPNVEEMPVGRQIYLTGPQGQPIPVVVTEKTAEHVVFDLNPPMAGKNLNFEITLVEVSG
jgi:FKBP-type peptidyl-prolyl cis-trans isomerase 2